MDVVTLGAAKAAMPRELGYAEFLDTTELLVSSSGGVTIPGLMLGVTVRNRAIVVQAGGGKMRCGTAGVRPFITIRDGVTGGSYHAASSGDSINAGSWVPVPTIGRRLRPAPGDYVFRLCLGSSTGAQAGITQELTAPGAWLRIWEV